MNMLKQTMMLCVWQAVHLNCPPPGEPPFKQVMRRIKWSLVAVIAPEVVALNAWVQYREARDLMMEVNRIRRTPPVSQAFWHRCLSLGSNALSALIDLPGQLRMMLRHRDEAKRNEEEERQRKNDDRHIRMRGDVLPWDIETAFFALSGGCVIANDLGLGGTLNTKGIKHLARQRPESLITVQGAVIQNPSKSSGLAKVITCAQALWFCSQCIARLSQDMAISLLELNTIAHCISAFFIYAFWWHKPYDVGTHVYIDDLALYCIYLLNRATEGIAMVNFGDVKELYVVAADTDAGSSLLFKAPRSSVSPVRERPNRDFVEISTGDSIFGTGFTLRFSETPYSMHLHNSEIYRYMQDGVFSLPHSSLAYWTRLWTLTEGGKSNLPSVLGGESGSSPPEVLATRRARNLARSFLERSFDNKKAFLVQLVMSITFVIYGGVHLLAWHYHFQTMAESILWRAAAITTASFGLSFGFGHLMYQIESTFACDLELLVLVPLVFWVVVDIAARALLIVECFKALPNSPASVYEIPRWTAYVPHI